MSDRRLPVRPNLEQLKHQAKDLLRDIRAGDPAALADWTKFSGGIEPAQAKLADAQLVLARSYEAPNWPRLVHACQLIDAIWEDDIDTVRALIEKNPQLLHEHATIRNSNWGPPMSYAANLGRDEIIRMLHGSARPTWSTRSTERRCRARSAPRECCTRCSGGRSRRTVASAGRRTR